MVRWLPTSLHRIHYNILFLLQQRPDLRSAVQMPVFPSSVT